MFLSTLMVMLLPLETSGYICLLDLFLQSNLFSPLPNHMLSEEHVMNILVKIYLTCYI